MSTQRVIRSVIARWIGAGALAFTCAVVAAAPVLADWTRYHFDDAHSGYDPGLPAVSSFSSNWNQAVDGDMMAEPLYLSGKVYAVTMHNNIYALDSATGAILWSVHTENPYPASSIPSCDSVPSDAVGIMSTPIIDPVANVLYAVGMNSAGAYHLWAVDLGGTHALKYPAVSVDPAPRDPGYTTQLEQNQLQNQRGALALNATGTLFIPYGGRDGDCGNYHGYVIAVHAADGTGVISYHTPFTSREAGMWAPGGIALDSSGNAFVATGNGGDCSTFDYGNSVLKLSPSLGVLSYWAPADWASLSCADTDIGSTAPSLVGGGRVFQSGKNGRGYLLSQSALGGIGGELYSASVCSSLSFGANAYFDPYIYVPCQDGLHALTLGASTFSSAWDYPGITAGPPIVAAGAVWVIDTSSGTLLALNPTTGALIDSHSVGSVEHFVTPAEGGGNIYVPGRGFVAAFSTSQWIATYDMSRAPTSWVQGVSQTFPVTVTNTGSVTWPSTGYYAVDLDLHFASYSGGSAAQQYWLSSLAFSLPSDVAPGASATVNVTLTPNFYGHVVLEAEMIKEHQFWFQQWQPVNVNVAAAVWSASYNTSTVPTSWTQGISQTFPLTVTNTGNVTWPSTGYYAVDLDLHFASYPGGSAAQQYWLSSLAFSLPSDVAPSASATVNVTLTPNFYGHVVLEAEMIKEHQFWFQQFAPVNVNVAAAVWSASYNTSTVPTSWTQGTSQTFPLTVTNTGNVTWPSTGYYAVDLDLHFASYPGGSAAQQYWLSSLAFSLPSDVAPGASVTVNVTLTPNFYGHVVLEAEMIKEHQFWFQQFAPVNVNVAAAVWSASYNLTGLPSSWTKGQSKSITVTVTNTGNVTWPSTGYYEVDVDFHFTTQTGGSAQQASWLTSQAFPLPADLAPGASVTVTVTVTAPTSAGSMFLEAEMIKEHQFWFLQSASVPVTVS